MRMHWKEASPWPDARPVLALGYFDGLHTGHRALLARARSMADQRNERCCMLGFDPHPLSVIADAPVARIYGDEEKAWLLDNYGWVDEDVRLTFDRELMRMSAEDFIRGVLIGHFHAGAVVVGEDFRFGYRNGGSVEHLKDRAFTLCVVPQVDREGQKVSSRAIREDLQNGRLERANRALEDPFFLFGTVEHGAGIGQRELVPTINTQLPTDRVLPADGVYVTRTYCGEAVYDSLTNVGTNPTFGNSEARRVETHLLNAAGDLYGKHYRLCFLARIREEIRFPDVAALKAQQIQDINIAKEYFGKEASL